MTPHHLPSLLKSRQQTGGRAEHPPQSSPVSFGWGWKDRKEKRSSEGSWPRRGCLPGPALAPLPPAPAPLAKCHSKDPTGPPRPRLPEAALPFLAMGSRSSGEAGKLGLPPAAAPLPRLGSGPHAPVPSKAILPFHRDLGGRGWPGLRIQNKTRALRSPLISVACRSPAVPRCPNSPCRSPSLENGFYYTSESVSSGLKSDPDGLSCIWALSFVGPKVADLRNACCLGLLQIKTSIFRGACFPKPRAQTGAECTAHWTPSLAAVHRGRGVEGRQRRTRLTGYVLVSWDKPSQEEGGVRPASPMGPARPGPATYPRCKWPGGVQPLQRWRGVLSRRGGEDSPCARGDCRAMAWVLTAITPM